MEDLEIKYNGEEIQIRKEYYILNEEEIKDELLRFDAWDLDLFITELLDVIYKVESTQCDEMEELIRLNIELEGVFE